MCCVLSPCSPLVWHFEEIHVGLLGCLSAASVLELTDISRQERTGRVSWCRPLIAVMLRVPLIGSVICILQSSILVSNCWETHLLTKTNGRLGYLIIVLVEWENVPGGPGATRVGVWWCVLDVLGRLWVTPCLVGPEWGLNLCVWDHAWITNNIILNDESSLTWVFGQTRSNADLQHFVWGSQHSYVPLTLDELHLSGSSSIPGSPSIFL